MSGGIAYVLDEAGDFEGHCNQEMVDLDRLEDPEEIAEVELMVRRHAENTRSKLAWRILALWEEMVPKFVKVMPRDYQKILQALKQVQAQGLEGEEAMMAAFRESVGEPASVR
jgi:glutamate synthase (ferredoxin)